MRLSIVVLSLSTAALAQVATAPIEQKIPADNTTASDDTTSNATAANEAVPGAPSTALVDSAAGKPPE